MKQFIVMAAVLPLLLVFLISFSEIQEYNFLTAAADDAVYAAKEMAKQEGCFSEKIQDWLRAELCKRIRGISREDIIIGSKTDTRPVPRAGSAEGSSGLIRYQISIPMPKRSSGTLLGVKQKSRPFYYIIDSYTTSEYLPPGSYRQGNS